MKNIAFDEYADLYDTWFLKNRNVLDSEVALLAYFLEKPGRAVSVGCGTGLFEKLLKQDYGIDIHEGVEPAQGMREVAIKRGMTVRPGTAEDAQFEPESYDTVIFNGTPSYIADLAKAFRNAWQALKKSGRLLVLDVPRESSYGLLYALGREIGTWNHPCFAGVTPENVYPIEFTRAANWRSTPEKVALLKKAGFADFRFAQTLTRHPVYSNMEKEEPVEGFDRGDYVCICAVKS